MVQAGLSRLIGLGIGFCLANSCYHRLELRLPSLAVESIIDVQEQSSSPPMDPVDVEVSQIAKADVGKVSLPMVDRDGPSSKMELVRVEEVEEVEDEVVSEGEEDWPSLGLSLGVTEES